MRAAAVMRAMVVASALSIGIALRASRKATKASHAQHRMQQWYQEYMRAPALRQTAPRQTAMMSSLISLREDSGTAPAAGEKRIFFERDHAGFNNIKLQLQSLVAIAAITGRTLVLPSPYHQDHVNHSYFEFDYFDPAALKSIVNVEIESSSHEHALEVEQKLAQLDVRRLDQDRDWFFKMWGSRIQHFECLSLSQQDHAYAAHAVLHGLVFDKKFETIASSGLQKLNLSEADFDCVHIRRGDFAQYTPSLQWDDAHLSSTLKGMLSGRPVLVVSDESPTLDLGTSVLFAKDVYSEEDDEEARLAVDMIMCSRARDFVGTPWSTFTNGIVELRNRHAVLHGLPTNTSRLYSGVPDSKRKANSDCWCKQTTFDDVKFCEDVNSTVCVAPGDLD